MIAEVFVRLVSWFVRKAGAGTLVSFTLLLISIEVLVWSLEASIRGLENSWLPFAAALGLLTGWWLARSKLRGWQAAFAGIAIGSFITLFQLGRLSGPLERLIFNLPLADGMFLSWQGLPDLSRLLPQLVELWDSARIPLSRLARWSGGIISGQPAYDPAATVFFWSLVLWSLALWQSWFVRRRSQPLLALLPSGVLLAITLNYTGESVVPLVAFLAVTLLLLSLGEFRSLVQSWERSGTDYSEDVRFEMALASLSLVLVLTTAAALTPSFSIQQLVEWTRNLRRQETTPSGQVAESLGLKPRSWGRSPFVEFFSPGLPRSHLLGSGPELSEQVVMAVQVQGIPDSTTSESANSPLSFYWRGLAYDRYTGRGWATGRTEIVEHPAGEAISTPALPSLRRVQQKVRLYTRPGPEENQLLYVAGEISSVDQETQVAWRSHGDILGALGEEEQYQATSFVSIASDNQLRNAGQDYPQWVLERYLAVPQTVPPRVLGLGRDLTATGATPYDQAIAIETYLRSIPYSLQVPAPPANRDVSDFFLFDLRRGYCDYYATTMVVLARAAGLPARLVIGFAPGQYDPGSEAFIVTAADAHSWVEIYFPGFGWVEFEPTGGRPAIVRSSVNRQQEAGSEDRPTVTGPEIQARGVWSSIFKLFSGLAALLFAGLVAWLFYDRWSLNRLTPSGTIMTLYHRLYEQGRSLDKEISPAFTPHEFAGQLSRQVAQIGQAGRFQRSLTPAAEEVEQLANFYVRSVYSPHPAGGEEQVYAIRTWKKLQWRLWLARLVQKKRA